MLSVKGRSIEEQSVEVPKTATPYVFPLAVLVNEKSASASEILTGALQDHDRAVVIGEPSFGKGLVQNVFPLAGNTALALTTAFYYTPSGRSIQKPLASGHLEIEKQAEQFQTDSGRTVTGGGGIQPDIAIGPEPPTRLRVALDASGMHHFLRHGVHPEARSQAGLRSDRRRCSKNLRCMRASAISSRRSANGARERAWLQSRLKQEIFNQALGVAKGDEVEAQRDPAVRAAIERLAAI